MIAQIAHQPAARRANVTRMAARQIWLFLTDADVQDLLRRLEEREPGLVASTGRYLKGNAAALLTDPTGLERRESLPAERRHYLLHRKHSGDVVAHEQPLGPFAGWSQLDEERTDCLVLREPTGPAGQLGPSRLYAHTSFWRGPKKTRKRPSFAIWANQTLRWALALYPSTGVDFMHIGPDALRQAKAGQLRLTYLYRPIAAEASAGAVSLAPPAGTLDPSKDDDED